MPSTPVYSIPYQALTDPPDGAGLGQAGFLAVETQLSRIDAAAATLNATVGTVTGAWTAYGPSGMIVAFGGGMAQGASTYTTRYRQAGKTVNWSFNITLGAGFTAGSGIWSFLLPVQAQSSLLGVGAVQVVDSGTAIYSMVATLIDSTHLRIYKNGALTALDAGGPGTAWAVGDQINGGITYEGA